MAKSFVDRMKPFHERSKPIRSPLAPEGEEAAMLTMRALGGAEIGVADTNGEEHFRKLKKKKGDKGGAWEPTPAARSHRRRAEIIFRAFVDDEGHKLGADVDEVEALHPAVVNTLYDEWDRFQDDIAVIPLNDAQMRELIDQLKKNIDAVPLSALPSIWLSALVRTLVSPPPPSTTDSSDG